jgi:NitT/TauT family transport system ATP-binding protein
MTPDLGKPDAVAWKHPKLDVRNVSKRFGSDESVTHALKDVSLAIREGEFIVLLGPSGCGKSTLLNLIAGLEHPDSGEVLADAEPVTRPGRDRMVMFQESALFPWLTVLGNVEFGLRLAPHIKRRARRETALRHLRMVGLEGFAKSRIHELSGGMKQRVALARCLAADPQVLLMDEPFAALDAMTRDQLHIDLQRIWSENKKTIVFVTHNVREAVCLADRVAIFSPRPGRIREQAVINLPRPRDINSERLARVAAQVTRVLQSHLKAAGSEVA